MKEYEELFTQLSNAPIGVYYISPSYSLLTDENQKTLPLWMFSAKDLFTQLTIISYEQMKKIRPKE